MYHILTATRAAFISFFGFHLVRSSTQDWRSLRPADTVIIRVAKGLFVDVKHSRIAAASRSIRGHFLSIQTPMITPIVLINAEPRLIQQTVQKLAGIHGASQVNPVSGEWDLGPE